MPSQSFLRQRLLVAALSLALPVAVHVAQAADAPGSIARKNSDIVYRIAQQETLSSIALKFTGSVRNWPALARANGIGNDRTIPIGNAIVIPSRLLPDKQAFATVVALRGDVDMIDKNGDVVTSRVGVQLPEGAVVVTGDEGFVAFQLQDGTTFSLPPSSNLQLTLLRVQDYTGRPRTELMLKQGRVTSEVTPFKLPGSRYQIQTPLAIAGVRGTRFRVHAEAGRSYSEVLHGAVGVTVLASASKTAKSASSTLAADYGSVVGGDGRQSAPIALLPAPSLQDTAPLQERLPLRIRLANPEAKAFRVTVSTDAAGLYRVAESRADAEQGTAQVRLADLEDGDYYLRAAAIDSIGLEGKESAQVLRLKARPFAPLLQTPGPKLRPADQGAAIAFQWAEVASVRGYHLQIARDANFTDLIEDRPALTATAYQQSGLAQGRYYWRVASVADKNGQPDQGPWSDVNPLDVLPPQAAPDASQRDDAMQFSWHGEPGQRFVFESAATLGFEQALVHIDSAAPRVSFPLPDAGTYYARVQAIDADGYRGAFSPPQKYSVERRWRTGAGGALNTSQGPVRAD